MVCPRLLLREFRRKKTSPEPWFAEWMMQLEWGGVVLHETVISILVLFDFSRMRC